MVGNMKHGFDLLMKSLLFSKNNKQSSKVFFGWALENYSILLKIDTNNPREWYFLGFLGSRLLKFSSYNYFTAASKRKEKISS